MTAAPPPTAISPLDGRYRARVAPLAPIVSEFGLMRQRVMVEVEWLLCLAAAPSCAVVAPLNGHQRGACEAIWRAFSVADAERIRDLEGETNHDVKAVEYFVKERIAAIDGLAGHVEFVHFACTSEDINNLAYGTLLQRARAEVLAPAMREVIDAIADLADATAGTPMLARTHGQPASPTTAGKELAVFVARLERHLAGFNAVAVRGKANGASGNYNAHVVACPAVDWPALTRDFVESLGLLHNPFTTQIEPRDYMAEYLDALARFNQTLLDFDQDMWGYVALGYFRQRMAQGESGSSTMPHKVNPIDFENSEGNLGVANALLGHLARKLAVSRWQRDLSDSTALRNVGVALGHSLVAWVAVRTGIAKLEIDRARLAQELEDSWEVLAEAVQTVMRAAGAPEPYERLKKLTRGRQLDAQGYGELLDALDLPPSARATLNELTPASYTGLAEQLALEAGSAAPEFRVEEVPWATHWRRLMAVRHDVFIVEQGVPEAIELDGRDPDAIHFIAVDAAGEPQGTARLLPDGQIGRVAVVAEARRRGVARRLLTKAIAAARQRGDTGVWLNAQIDALALYEQAGFRAVGETFLEAGMTHQRMELGF